MPWTDQGMTVALGKLLERQERNKPLPEDYNATLYAGEPMFYNCAACLEVFSLPEDWMPPRRQLCDECEALKEKGWLTVVPAQRLGS